MKISYNWLRNYLDIALSPAEIGEILTSTGLEVESIEKIESIKGGLAGVIVGEVLTKEKHPEADRLSLTTVNLGNDNIVKIVCGAANVASGQKVLVATIGSTLYPLNGEPIKIKKSKIRGHESEGMICAEDELGLGDSHDGIIILPSDTIVGKEAKTLFDLDDDFLLEIGLTPNRSDAMSHIGVARDLKAYLNFHSRTKFELKKPATAKYSDFKNKINFDVTIQNSEACPRYCGAIITHIKVQESPKWLQVRLKSIGLKPINNVVDITNFVMHEAGNPLHAFDLSKVGTEIIVRPALDKEKLITLDNIERSLDTNDLLICNSSQPLCIAGVMGGLNSGISENTVSLFLESAYFNPSSIRKTSKRHAINSDSSFRFERGVDVDNTIFARDRAIDLILEICGGELEYVCDQYPNKIERSKINFEFEKCRKLCGAKFSNEQITAILNELEFALDPMDQESIEVTVPGYRHDVKRAVDLSEEVLRIYGFNQVDLPAKLNTSITYASKPDRDKLYNLIADNLVSSGFYEIMNNSLSSDTYLNAKTQYLKKEESISVLNPLSNELNVMRQSLIPGGLSVVEFNLNRQQSEIKLFEFGKSYHLQNQEYIESNHLTIFISGQRAEESWVVPTKNVDFHTLKSTVNKTLVRLGLFDGCKESSDVSPIFQEGVSLSLQNKVIGEYGWVKSSVLKEFGIKLPVFVADLNWDLLIHFAAQKRIEFAPIPKTQFVRRDFSLLLDNSVQFSQVEKIAHSVDKKILRHVNLFDVYEGKNLPAGKKSYAVSFTFQDSEKTLQDEQIDRLMVSIRTKLESELKAELR